jgi:hypothetical protein
MKRKYPSDVALIYSTQAAQTLLSEMQHHLNALTARGKYLVS